MRQAARRRQHRHRRRLPGDRRGLQHHHARPRRQRHDGRRPGRRAAGRRLRDLHRRRRRLHDRPAACCPRPAASSRISYDEMLELASLGAGVMHSRSIEFAKKFDVPIHVRSSFTDVPGTMIVAEPESPDQAGQRRGAGEGRGPRHDRGRARPARHEPGDLLQDRRQEHRGRHDRAERRRRRQGRHLVHRAARRAADDARSRRRGRRASSAPRASRHDDNVAKVSVVGLGMATQTGVAEQMFRALADAGVNIQMITTSEIKISVLVARDQGAGGAARSCIRRFELEKAPAAADVQPRRAQAQGAPAPSTSWPACSGMEDLTIDDIALDETQARVTLSRRARPAGRRGRGVRATWPRGASSST